MLDFDGAITQGPIPDGTLVWATFNTDGVERTGGSGNKYLKYTLKVSEGAYANRVINGVLMLSGTNAKGVDMRKQTMGKILSLLEANDKTAADFQGKAPVELNGFRGGFKLSVDRDGQNNVPDWGWLSPKQAPRDWARLCAGDCAPKGTPRAAVAGRPAVVPVMAAPIVLTVPAQDDSDDIPF